MTIRLSRVPIALATGDANTEEGRSFFQSRLALFGGWVFVTSAVFNIVVIGLNLALGGTFIAGMAFHLAGTLTAGVIWLTTRSGRLSPGAARNIDAAGTLLICIFFSLMAAALANRQIADGNDPLHELSVGVMACTYVLFARAIAIPSTPARTLGISTLAMFPMLLVTAFIVRHPDLKTADATYVDPVLWTLVAVPMAAVTSQVIFGLRAEVSKISQLGQYTLEEKIGEGGMGVVYRGRHALLRRPTAIKLLAPDKVGEDSIKRFEREVQLTANLSHPSTVAVFDYGRTPDGVFYYAMEFLDGITLEQLVQADGAQPPGRVVQILRQVAGALSEAHEIGLVHRDVKPANIMLCERGGIADVAKVVDFGLVKHFETNSDDATLGMTGTHVLLGTPQYMAPEAISGASAVDARSDIYALGAVGYFLLTGTPVFSAKSVFEMCAHHLNTQPEEPSARTGKKYPKQLESLILQCLSKSPDDRPRDARALLRLLNACVPAMPWTDEEAETWWARFRETRAARPTEPAPSDEKDRAMVAELANRVNQFR